MTTVGPAMVRPKNSRAPGGVAPAWPQPPVDLPLEVGRAGRAPRSPRGRRPRPDPRSYWRDRNSSDRRGPRDRARRAAGRSDRSPGSSRLPYPEHTRGDFRRSGGPAGPGRPAVEPAGQGWRRAISHPPGPGAVAEPVVQAVVPVLPELVGLGSHPHAAPPRRPGHRPAGVLRLQGLDPGVEQRAVVDRPGSGARHRRRSGPRGAGWRSRRRTPRRRSAPPSPRCAPAGPAAPSRRGGRRGDRRSSSRALAAVVVGVEHEPVLAPALEEHHPHRRPAVGVGRGHRHGLRGWPPRWRRRRTSARTGPGDRDRRHARAAVRRTSVTRPTLPGRHLGRRRPGPGR